MPKVYKDNSAYAKEIFTPITKEISHGRIQKQTWTDQVFEEMQVYKINKFTPEDLERYGMYMVDSISKKEVSMDTCYAILILACHLHKIAPGKEFTLFELPLKGSLPLPKMEVFAAWNKEQAEEGREEDGKRSEESGSESEQEEISVDPKKGVGKKASDPQSATAIDKERAANCVRFFCFCAAFYLRLCIKDIQDLSTPYTRMKERYTRFYQGVIPSSGEDVPPSESVKSLKTFFAGDRIISRTWVKLFVPWHDKAEVGSPQDGMVIYLAVLPFAFSGMHALKLMDDVIEMTHLKDTDLIYQMMHPRHNSALASISEIYAKHYPEEGSKKNTYVKYARVVGPQFFPALQTKKCKGLVCVLANLVVLHQKTTEETGDPRSIAGIDDISDELMKFGRRMAKIMMRNAPKTASYMYSSTAREAEEGGDSTDEESEEDEEDIDTEPLKVGRRIYKP
ncbi:nucleoprotein [Passionfruit-associated rhabdovirus YN]|nr:nucleoprotein [Passionfruit-associated rhabdovirus YN]